MPSFLSLTAAGINFIEVNLLSVSDDLSTQHIEVNCFTFRVNLIKLPGGLAQS